MRRQRWLLGLADGAPVTVYGSDGKILAVGAADFTYADPTGFCLHDGT